MHPKLFSFLRVGPRPVAFGTFFVTPFGEVWGGGGGGGWHTEWLADMPPNYGTYYLCRPTISVYLGKRNSNSDATELAVWLLWLQNLFCPFSKKLNARRATCGSVSTCRNQMPAKVVHPMMSCSAFEWMDG